MAACLVVALGCSKPKAKPAPPKGDPASSAEATDSPATSASAPSNILLRHTPVRAEDIRPPPLTPPADALTGPGGVRYQILRQGTGEMPGPLDSIRVDVNMWTSDGHLAQSSYTDQQAAAFSVASLPVPMRSLLTTLHQGSRVRYYLPRAAMNGWRPEAWPDADLIIELELLRVSHVDSITDGNGQPFDPVASKPPDASGPPATAATTASGLKYVFLEHGVDTARPKASDHVDLRLDVYAIEGLTTEPLVQNYKTGTTIEGAPANLGEILTQMASGDRVRVWLPAGVAKQVIPQAGDRAAVMNLSATY